MGKRVDFSARTVISPDPNLSMDEVGVPTGIAQILTFPERVTRNNKERMKKLVENGPEHYPGATCLHKKNGIAYDLSRKRNFSVEIGDVVDRFIENGDYVIFNRQPSLHRMSMMCHRVKVLPYSSFRMNLCDTTPYNADFDGDEMNLHVPQTLDARAELAILMKTPTQIITPESNTRQGDPFTICYYCHDTIWKCDHELNLENGALYCATHSHVEFFYTFNSLYNKQWISFNIYMVGYSRNSINFSYPYF